ncbi:hypothetical protein ABEB36_006475 [Hypothenemus hampei]|uniref:Uncharacterized protein n=1 Tax=Hypothenemus hampei TaxID=57062 RepID=A0ABD1EQM7_HYPHA
MDEEVNDLLMRHQIFNNPYNEDNGDGEQQTTYYEEEITTTRTMMVPKGIMVGLVEQLKFNLATVEMQESLALEEHTRLEESCKLLENLLEQVLNHLDCVILSLNSENRLVTQLNAYTIREQCLNEKISTKLKNWKVDDLSRLKKIQSKLLTILKHDAAEADDDDDDNDVKNRLNEFRSRQSNYKLALKNFKIILEIFNVEDGNEAGSLRKLKRQFDQVLMDYQHCRCILDRELMPYFIVERTQLLADCLISLGAEYDIQGNTKKLFNGLLGDVGRKIRDNEYFLVKKEHTSFSQSESEVESQ